MTIIMLCGIKVLIGLNTICIYHTIRVLIRNSFRSVFVAVCASYRFKLELTLLLLFLNWYFNT